MDRLISRSLAQRVPLSVHLDLTYRCNERCIHCYLDHDDRGELSTAEVSGILNQLAAAGTLFLTFSGGEIFLREDLFLLLEQARRQRFDVGLKTNGVLLDRERARRLRELGISKVQVSIYSARPEVHDAITRLPGSLEQSLQAIDLCRTMGLPVKMACPLMRQNVHDHAGVVSLAAERGIPFVMDLTITPHREGGRNLLPLRLAAESLLPVLQDPRVNPPRPAPVMPPAGGKASRDDAYHDIPCSAGHNSCYISPYADVFPCVQMPHPAGNLRRQTFAAIWHDAPQLQEVRALRESDLPVCRTCDLRPFCERCPGSALVEHGDLTAAVARACELAEVRARLAGVVDPVSAWHRQNIPRGLPPVRIH